MTQDVLYLWQKKGCTIPDYIIYIYIRKLMFWFLLPLSFQYPVIIMIYLLFLQKYFGKFWVYHNYETISIRAKLTWLNMSKFWKEIFGLLNVTPKGVIVRIMVFLKVSRSARPSCLLLANDVSRFNYKDECV